MDIVNNLDLLKTLTIPRGTNPGYTPGDIVVDGQNLKFRAEDYSVVTISAAGPPPTPVTLQIVTTNGDTTSVGIVVTGGGLTMNGGNVQVNAPSGMTAANDANIISGGGVNTILTSISGLSTFQADLNFTGGAKKITNSSGDLTLDPFADLILNVGTGLIHRAGLLNITSPAAINLTASGNITLNSGTGNITLRPVPGNYVRIDGLLGVGTYRNFEMKDMFLYGQGIAPSLANVSNTSAHVVASGSNQMCGRLSFTGGIGSFSCSLTLSQPISAGGELACFLSPCNTDDDFYDAAIRINSTNVNTGVIVIGGTGLASVQYDMYYWIVGMT